MPTIPLFNEGQTVKARAIQPPNLARSHQVVVNIADAARNFAAPSIPWQLTDNRGGRALGAAFGQIAGLLEQRALKQAEAINIRQAAEADMAMESAHAEFEAWKLQNPDETKWAGEWQNRLSSLRSTVLTDALSPKAAEDIGLRFDLFSNKSLSNVQTSAAKASFQKAGETLTAQALRAYDSGNFEEGDAYIEEGVKRNFIAGDTAARMQLAAKSEAESRQRAELKDLVSAAIDERRIDDAKALVAGAPFLKDHERKATLADIGARAEAAMQADEVQALTLTKPAEAVRLLNDPAKFDKIAPGDRQAMIARAKEVQAGGAVEAFRDIKTRIALGQVKAGEAFDGPGMQDLTPLMRDMLKAENAAHHDEAAKAMRVKLQNSPAIYENAVGVIAGYDPAQDEGGLRKAEIGAALETHFSGPYLDELRKRLDARGTIKPGEIDDAPALAMLKEWTDAGGLGEFKAPVMQDGKPVVRDPKATGFIETPGWFWGTNQTEVYENDGKPVPVTQIDPVKQAQAASKLSTIRKTIEAEVKAGKFTSNDEVLNRAVELFQQHGGKAPATSPAASGALLLLPALDSKQQARALEILNYKPAK